MSFFRWAVMTAVLAGVAGAQTVVRRPTLGSVVDGVQPYPAPGATSEAVLEEMAGRAAVIFVGTVTEVRMPEEGGGVVAVEFAVSDAVRGVAGGAYVVREWVGLWRDGARYRAGDRRLMLLHAPGPGGLSSPVDGMDGVIPVGPVGGVAMALSVGSAVVVGESVDLRWLQAKTMRTAGFAAAQAVSEPAAEEPQPALARVMGMLAGWEARRNAGR